MLSHNAETGATMAVEHERGLITYTYAQLDTAQSSGSWSGNVLPRGLSAFGLEIEEIAIPLCTLCRL